MSTLGLALSSTEVRGVLLDAGNVVWRFAQPIGAGERLADAIGTLLQQLPRRRLRRPKVVVALSPGLCQVKKLSGIPPTLNASQVQNVLHTSCERFFLRCDAPLSPPTAYRNGAWWGAVFRQLVISDVERACAAARLRYLGAIPSVTGLAALCRDGIVECEDGSARVSINVSGRDWLDVRRERDQSASRAAIALPPQLRDAAAFRAAYAAACAGDAAPLLLSASRAQVGRHRAMRVSLLAAMFVAATLLALAGPALRASRQLSDDRQQLAALRAASRDWQLVLGRLHKSAVTLGEVSRFTAGHRSVVALLAGMTRALPDSTAIIALRIDTALATATVLSTNAAAVVVRLGSVPGVEDARISGALTRENVNGVPLQRVAVRLRLGRASVRTP